MTHLKSRRRKPWKGIATAVLALSIIATGCSATDPTETTAQTEATTTVPGSETTVDDTATEEVSGGVVTVATSDDPKPQLVLMGQQANWSWQKGVFETLTRLDENSAPQPLLAEDWTLADDLMSIDITLREGVTFHSGSPLTTEDVKFSIEASRDPLYGSQLAGIANDFTAIELTSDTEMTIEFARPLANLFDYFEITSILDSETAAGLADGSQVIGTGPFLWEEWLPGTSLTLVRNEDYWGEPALLDGIEVAVITDQTALVNAVRSGRAQYAIGLSGIDVASFRADPDFEVIQTTGTTYPLAMNVEMAPFDQVEVRQAVNYAIDRQRISDQVYGGSGQISLQFWPVSAVGYDPEIDDMYPYDPEKARQMLEEAGAIGAEFEITVVPFPGPISHSEIVRNNLEAVGLKPTLVFPDLAEFIVGQNTDLDLGPMFFLIHGYGFSPATHLNSFPSLRPSNPSRFASAEYDALREAVFTASPDETAAAVREVSAYVAEQAWSLPLVYVPGEVVVSPNLEGAKSSANAYAEFKEAFFTE